MLSAIKKSIPQGLKTKAKLALHKGNKYTCPFCNYSSKDLSLIGEDIPVLREKQVIGAGLRAAGCHKCASSDRERLIYALLKHELSIFDGDKKMDILHIAPEKNLTQVILKAGFDNYVCGDLFTEGYEYASHVQNMNVLDLPFDQGTYDLLICNHVLEHIPNDVDAMNEIRRVLKTGGKAILQVPLSHNTKETFEDLSITSPEDRERVFGQFDHLRIYGQDYSEKLENLGFKVDRINITSDFPQYGLDEREDVFVCTKK